jgi:hypothetical protein
MPQSEAAGGFIMDWAVATLIPDPRFLGSQNPSVRYAQRYGLGMVIYAALRFASIFFV